MTDIINIEAIESQAAVWVARRDAAERWTPELEQELQAWMAQSPAHHIAWLRLSAAWQRMGRLVDAPAIRAAQPSTPAAFVVNVDVPDAVPTAEPPATPATGRVPRGGRRRVVAGWALAAGIALGIGVAAVVQWNASRGEQFATQVGAREAVTLADGSHVTLNTHTRGRAVVNERERRFWLDEGEAYFEIAHDPSRPFVVLAGRDRVTVLGTKFSVRHEGGRTEVTVLEGRVRLDRGAPGGGPSVPVVMTRNESAVALAGNVLVVAKNEQAVRDELSWREGRLVFDQITLAEVADRFNRYNSTQLVIEGTAAERRFSGSFDANNVDGFARLMHESFGLDVRTEGTRIVVAAD
jgi:transmembrane sensor